MPFRLTNVAATFQDALRGKFADQVECAHLLADQIADQPPPAINMLHLGRCPGVPLQTIPKENPGFESQDSTETLAETFSEQLLLPPFRGGAIFNVSVDSPLWNGKTEEERVAQENRNVNRVQRRENEAAIARAEAARNNRLDSQGRQLPLHRDLDEEFLHVDGHDIFKTPSANLAVAANKLTRLP